MSAVSVPPDVGERPAFTVGRTTWRWQDVVRWAWEQGRFAPVERETWQGLACLDASRREAGLPEAQVKASATDYRRARRLLSAEETEAWLAAWGLAVSDWMSYIRRTVARRQYGDEAVLLAEQRAPVAADVAACVWATAICSGMLEAAAADLAARVAAQAALADVEAAPADFEEAYDRFCHCACTHQALQRQLETHVLDWTRVDYESVTFLGRDAAQEALLCVREDGMALSDVARHAGGKHRWRSMLLQDLPEVTRPLLLGAPPGGLLGPVADDAGFALLLVTGKRAPSLEDSQVRALAERAVVAAAVAREVGDRVRWHGGVSPPVPLVAGAPASDALADPVAAAGQTSGRAASERYNRVRKS